MPQKFKRWHRALVTLMVKATLLLSVATSPLALGDTCSAPPGYTQVGTYRCRTVPTSCSMDKPQVELFVYYNDQTGDIYVCRECCYTIFV